MTFKYCPECGSDAVEQITVPFTVEHGDKRKTFQDRRMRCSACENWSYQGEQISEHERAVAAAVRELDGLLSSEELLRIRAKYRFKQAEMEQMLSTGPKTWTRWERGKIPHSKAADKLIRVIAENPDIARRLMEQAGVINAEAVAVFEQIERDENRIARAALRASVGEMQNITPDALVDRFYDQAVSARKLARESVLRAEAA